MPPTAQLKADASSPWARQWCAGPVNGTWSTSFQSCWCFFCWVGNWKDYSIFLWFLWRVVWWFLLKMFFMFWKWFWVCLWPIPYSCVPIPSHETGSILLYQQVLVLWLKHHRLMVYVWCAALLGMFVGETNLPVPWHEIHDSLRASAAASQHILQGDRKKWIEADRSVS